ncbi:MAG: GntR family transcriptional regulator [Nocardioides sp.]|nr:GntR family transcriptional regulator [Nocardioides sp.]
MSTRVESTLLADKVHAVLHDAIMSGELPAGSRLRIRDIAEQVGTSVMPVREAIRRLEESGLAERQPHKGAVVKELSLAELLHVYDTRLLLEGEAARLGAAGIMADEVESMEETYEKLRAAIKQGQIVEMLDLDEAFLATLYRASRNPVLVSTITGLWRQCRAYKIVGAVEASTDDSLWRHQHDLLVAARDRDGAAALAASNESLEEARARIRAHLATQAQGAAGD